MKTDIYHYSLTMALAILGGLIASTLGFPAPYLTGPALAVTLGSLSGLHMSIPFFIRDASFILIGIGLGSSITPQVLTTISRWPLSIVVLAITLYVVFSVSAKLLRALFKYDHVTSVLASCPGHLSYVLGLGADSKGDLEKIALAQCIRVLALTLIVPFIIVLMNGTETTQSVSTIASLSLFHLMSIVLLSLLVGMVFRYFKIPAALLLAGMAASSAGHLSELTPGDLPSVLTTASFMTMGALIGTRFTGVSLQTLRDSLSAGAVATASAFLFSLAGATIVSLTLGIPLTQTLVAFAPGGLEAMAAIAFMLDAEPSFVTAHHVFRLLFLTFLIPLELKFKAHQ